MRNVDPPEFIFDQCGASGAPFSKVISGIDLASLKKIEFLYKKIFKSLHKTKSVEIAEMSKLVENSYRSVNIGLVNELKMICHKLKIDIHEVLAASKTKPFGFNAFYPGPGVGGHCIPVDPYYLTYKAKKHGIITKFIKLASQINDKRPVEISNTITKYIT